MQKRYITRLPPLVVRFPHNAALLAKYDRDSQQALLRLTAQPLTPQLIGGIRHARI